MTAVADTTGLEILRALCAAAAVAALMAWSPAARSEDPPPPRPAGEGPLPESPAGAPIELLPPGMRGQDAQPVPVPSTSQATPAAEPAAMKQPAPSAVVVEEIPPRSPVPSPLPPLPAPSSLPAEPTGEGAAPSSPLPASSPLPVTSPETPAAATPSVADSSPAGQTPAISSPAISSPADPSLTGPSPSGPAGPTRSPALSASGPGAGAEGPAALSPRSEAAPELAGAVRVMSPDGCPRARLVEIWTLASGAEDELALLALEGEALRVCAERERALAEILEAESRSRDALTAANETVAGEASIAEGAPTSPAGPAGGPFLLDGLGSNAPAQAGTPQAEAPKAAGSAAEAAPARAPVPAKRPARPAGSGPTFTWFSIYGAGEMLTAGVSDGASVWWVRAGDVLPGGERVERIAVRPTRVVLSGAGPLGYRDRPAEVNAAAGAGR